ncbi:MAG: NADH-quinone oxidoreductase subunit C [Dehalococcoidia bacterium]
MTEQTPKPEAEAPSAEAKQAAASPLNDRGRQTARALQRVASSFAQESGGRDDIPWVRLPAERLHDVAERCKDDRELRMDMLHCLFAVDYVERIEVDYILVSIATDRKVMLKVDLPPEGSSVGTVTDLWQAATWFERETHDLFGVTFDGNDDLEPLLLFDGFEGYPGRKSFPLHDYEEW